MMNKGFYMKVLLKKQKFLQMIHSDLNIIQKNNFSTYSNDQIEQNEFIVNPLKLSLDQNKDNTLQAIQSITTQSQQQHNPMLTKIDSLLANKPQSMTNKEPQAEQAIQEISNNLSKFLDPLGKFKDNTGENIQQNQQNSNFQKQIREYESDYFRTIQKLLQICKTDAELEYSLKIQQDHFYQICLQITTEFGYQIITPQQQQYNNDQPIDSLILSRPYIKFTKVIPSQDSTSSTLIAIKTYYQQEKRKFLKQQEHKRKLEKQSKLIRSQAVQVEGMNPTLTKLTLVGIEELVNQQIQALDAEDMFGIKESRNHNQSQFQIEITKEDKPDQVLIYEGFNQGTSVYLTDLRLIDYKDCDLQDHSLLQREQFRFDKEKQRKGLFTGPDYLTMNRGLQKELSDYLLGCYQIEAHHFSLFQNIALAKEIVAYIEYLRNIGEAAYQMYDGEAVASMGSASFKNQKGVGTSSHNNIFDL